jgi:hypothetical protein
MAILPALDWLLAHWRGGTVAPQVPPLIARRAAEARVNAELPLARRRSAATLLGGQVLPCRATPPLAALLRPVTVPAGDKAGAVDLPNADRAPRLAVC